jgi:acetylornithine/succinyldiaminopimelate/putrescine aminotransferase
MNHKGMLLPIMPNEESHLKEAANSIKKAYEWIKDIRGQGTMLNETVPSKLFQIAQFQNQALEKLLLAIENLENRS